MPSRFNLAITNSSILLLGLTSGKERKAAGERRSG